MKRLDQSSLHPLIKHPETGMTYRNVSAGARTWASAVGGEYSINEISIRNLYNIFILFLGQDSDTEGLADLQYKVSTLGTT